AIITDVDAVDFPVFVFPWTNTFATCIFHQHGLVIGNTFNLEQETVIIGSSTNPFTIVIPAGTQLLVSGVIGPNAFAFDWTAFLVDGGGGSPGTPTTAIEGSTVSTNPDAPLVAPGIAFTASAPISLVGQPDWFTANLGETALLVFTGSPLFAGNPDGLSAV